MKIKLTNFRTHKKATFAFPETGLVLLSGSSGSGKSTLIKAILYAFFGAKAVRKPYTFGAKTCKVELEFGGMKIIRTSHPNRLLVNDLEDASAQAYIDQKLGTQYEEFLVSSYIPQKNNSSILSLPQTEQLRFINALALDDHKIYKERLKEIIKDSGAKLNEERAEATFCKQELEEYEDLEEVVFPLDKKDSIEEFQRRLQNYPSKIEKLMGRKLQLSTLLSNANQLLELEKQYGRLTKRKKELESLTIGYHPTKIEATISELEDRLERQEAKEELEKLRRQYQDLLQTEQKTRKKKMDKLSQDLWTTEEIDESEERLNELQEERRLQSAYQRAQKQFKQLQKELKSDLEYEALITEYEDRLAKVRKTIHGLKLCRGVMRCPECEATLRLADGELQSVEVDWVDNSQDELKEHQNLENKYLRSLKRIRGIQIPEKPSGSFDEDELEALLEELNEQRSKRQDLDRLRNEGESPALKKLQREISRREAKKSGDEIDGDIKQIREELYQQQELLKNLEKNTAELDEVTQELLTVEKKKKRLETTAEPNNIQEELEKVNGDLQRIKKARDKDEALREPLEEHLQYISQSKEQKKWQERLAECQKRLQRAEAIHTANLTLKERYAEAEILALRMTINSINEHTRYYLETFFPEQQLTAELETIFKGKAQTLRIGTSINYKGNEYENISQLSGGEFDRCTLASICGINSMLNSPILILDESLSSLDAETNTEIIRFLSELAEYKLIIVCSHEAVKGIFDTVIKL